MNGYRLLLSCAVAALLASTPAVVGAQNHPALDAPGFQQNRDYFSAMPFENIDTLSGGLILTFTDLALPGNAGRELRFQRTYNSKTGVWTFGIAGVALRISDPPRPSADTPGIQERTPALLMGDGSVKTMAWYVTPDINNQSTFDVAISSDFSRFHRVTNNLSIPNGDVCHYEPDSQQYMLRVQTCWDAFNNQIDFNWQLSANPPQLVVTQHLSPSTSRLITLNFATPTTPFPTSMLYEGRSWNYGPTNVTSPEGLTWSFGYDGLNLTSVTTPHGGVITYTYSNQSYEGPESPQVQYATLVVASRTMNDRGGLELGRWDYSYAIDASGISGNTTVLMPSGRILYRHGWNESPLAVFDGIGGTLPLVQRIVQRPGGQGESEWVEIEREDRTYKLLSVLSWWTFGTLELETTSVRRDGATQPEYVSTNTYDIANFGDYHNPKLITEEGTAGTRSTVRSFQHYPAANHVGLYRVGLPLTEAVTVGAETFSKSWTYNLNDGFKTSETIYGLVTEFGKGSFGNIASARKANNKLTTFTYQFGQPKTINTPKYTIARSINTDGSIASETRAGRTTAFAYDDLGRLTSIQPPGGPIPTVIDYDNGGGEWVRTTRGTSAVTTSLDGFGRRVETVNAVAVRSRTQYDAEGRVIREGYPFRVGDLSGGVDIGMQIIYDPLGRVTKRINPGGSSSTLEYGLAGVVTVRDENNRTTVLNRLAFGNPDESRLADMIDAEGHVWSYGYNALSRLVSVTAEPGVGGPAPVIRTWSFNQRNLLQSETHPESGATTYIYDVAGMLAKKTDAKGTETVYTYDGNDRVETITVGNRLTTITYEPGSDNRTSAVNVSAGSIWRYEPATGRLQSRQDALDGKLFTTAFEYDTHDRLKTIQHPSGRRVQYEFNFEGQPTRVYEAAAGRDYATGITYHASGGLASYLSGGLTTTIGYDDQRYWVRKIESGPMLLNYDNYDGVGNPQTIHDARAGFGQSFTYDSLDRLTGAAGAYGAPTYTYDVHGNRTGAAYQYQPGKLRLASQDALAFTYDANGNALTAGSATFSYTPQNQVETATNLGVSAAYAYDADDQRVKKTIGASTTYFIRGLGGEVLTEWKDPGTGSGRIRNYVYLGTRLLSAVARNSAEDPSGVNTPATQSHRFATSWQVPSGSGSNAVMVSGATVAARKSSHPDMPRTGLRLGLGSADSFENGPMFDGGISVDQPRQSGLLVEFEVERYPYSVDAEWLAVDGNASSQYPSQADDLRLYLTPGGYLVLKHDGGRNPALTLWTSSAPVGLLTPHTIELRSEFNSTSGPYPLPNPLWDDLTSWAQVIFDGALVYTHGAAPGGTWASSESGPRGLDRINGEGVMQQIRLKSPAAGSGLLMNVWRAGLSTAKNHSDSLDSYGSAWRTTLLEVAANGTHAQWSGGQPDWRARSIIAGTFINPVSTTVSGQKISYRVESMLTRGITGTIGAVLVGVRMQTTSANTRAFIRRNGAETILTDLVLTGNTTRWYRVAQAGWSPTDVIEIGVTSGDNVANSLNAVALMVEHNTPEPQPLTDASTRVLTASYSGNGGAQTIDFGVDLTPTALLVMQVGGSVGSEPIWWWDSRQGAAPMADAVTNFGRMWPQKGKFHVVHPTSGKSYNASGVSYIAIAIFDPSARYIIPFAVSKPSSDDDYTHALRHPQSGALAWDFTPDFVFGGAAFDSLVDGARASLYRGPGHVGDLTGKLIGGPSDANRIQAIGPGTVQFGTTIGHGPGDFAFWAGRVDDGVSPTRLMAVTSYVGTGTASRNIALSLTGEAPVFALVVPTSSANKAYRVSGDTTGRTTGAGGALANSITALSANQISVGLALNAVGVTYDVWAITTGLVTPW